MRLKSSLALSAALTALLYGGWAQAQTSPPASAPAAPPAATDSEARSETSAAVEEVVVSIRNRVPDLNHIAGNTTVISADKVEQGRVATIADALKYEPGLLAQSATGAEATRFSMRGSGVIRSPSAWGTGIQMLYDGLPLTTPEGSPYEYYEALANNYIEVYRGANAFEFSPTTQGGAINYVPHTGKDAAPLLVRLEGGSFGYNRQQISSGKVLGPLDYYVSATHFGTDGFRRGARSFSWRLLGNIGYEISPKTKTRFHYEVAAQNTRSAQALTLAQIAADPRQNTYTGVGNSIQSNRREKQSLLLGNRTTWTINDDETIEAGFLYKTYPLRNQGGAYTPGDWDIKDLALSLRYKRHHELFGLESDTEVAWLDALILPGSTNTGYYYRPAVTGPNPIPLFSARFGGYDNTVLVKNDLRLTPNLTLTTGLASIWQSRSSEIRFPSTAKQVEDYYVLAPRLGLTWNVTPQIQLYGNVSRSDEAPISHQLPTTTTITVPGFPGITANASTDNVSIRNQVQDTWEAGIRGEWKAVRWNLTYYHARIEREILTVIIDPNSTPVKSITSNANSPTIHEGFEGTLDIRLLDKGGHTLTWRNSATFNDFHFVNDPLYGNNTLPAVPQRLYQGGLDYTHPSGFYAGLNAEAVLKDYPADFYNTIITPSYTIWGARVGYRSPDRAWEFFLQGDNLGDEHYAAVVSPAAKGTIVGGINTSAAYSPGQTRFISAGLTHAF